MKIKAFTIMEIVINLAIIGIIVTITYSAYLFFSRSLYEYTNASSENFEQQFFYQKIMDDFYTCQYVTKMSENTFKIVFYNKTFVQYKHKQGYLFREQNGTVDSIKVTMLTTKLLEKNKVQSDSIIENISLKASLFEQEIPMYVNKEYFADYKLLGL